MGWIDTLFLASNAISSMSTAATLSEMKRGQVASAEAQALLDLMRSQLFEIKQLADEALEEESIDPKVAAFHLCLLGNRVETSGIPPDLFPQFVDKEYAANTYKTIRQQKERLLSSLPQEERSEISEAVYAVSTLENTKLFINQYPDAVAFRQAQSVVKQLRNRNTQCPPLAFILVYGLIGFSASLLVFFTNSVTPCALGLVIMGGLVYLQVGVMKFTQYDQARKTIQKTTLDMKQFSTLESLFGNVQKAQEMQYLARVTLNNFYAGSPLTDDVRASLRLTPQPTIQIDAPLPSHQFVEPQQTKPVAPVATAASSATTFCVSCGKEVGSEWGFCPYCGNKVG